MISKESHITEQLHRLIDGGAAQPVINERIAGLMENQRNVGIDHEKRLRYLKRTVAWALGGIGVISAALMVASNIWK